MTVINRATFVIQKIKIYANLDFLKLLTLLVLFALVVHRLHAKVPTVKSSNVLQDTNYCASQTLQNGEYDNRTKSWKSSKCDIHLYDQKDVGACTEKIYEAQKRPLWIMMFGDSKVRDFLKHFEKTLNMTMKDVKPKEVNAADLHFTNKTNNLNIRYVDKFGVTMRVCTSETLHLKATQHLMKYYINDERLDNILKLSITPDIILFGMSIWYLEDYPKESQRTKLYREDTKKLNEKIKDFPTKIAVIWKHGESTLKKWHYRPVIQLNRFAGEDFRNNSRVSFWNVPRNALKNFRDFRDHVHYQEHSYNASFQSLFNFYCNPIMKWGENYCCNNVRHSWSIERKDSSPFSVFPADTFLISVFLIVCYSFLRFLKSESIKVDSNDKESSISLLDCVWNILKMICIINYFILCERENFFIESSKSNISLMLLAASLSFGLFTIKPSNSKLGVLTRDVTSGWKGWMQMMILIYHYSGLSKNLMVYMHMRVLVAAYIFLTGYGHYCYASSGKPMGLKRYFSVMFRLNFLTVLLCVVMSQPYLNYYFVPLISFWFSMVYSFLSITIRLSKKIEYQIITRKTLIIPVISLMIFNEVFPYEIYLSQEWLFRSRLDRLSAFTGVLFGLYIQCTKDSQVTSPSNKIWSVAKIFLSVLGLSSYVVLSSLCSKKEECNQIHPFISWIPIISYVCLRHGISSYHSKFFSWVGSFSLELFLCQYHIWMTDNTHKILILLPDQFLLNLILTTVSLFLIPHEIHRVTNFAAKLLSF